MYVKYPAQSSHILDARLIVCHDMIMQNCILWGIVFDRSHVYICLVSHMIMTPPKLLESELLYDCFDQ